MRAFSGSRNGCAGGPGDQRAKLRAGATVSNRHSSRASVQPHCQQRRMSALRKVRA